MPGDERWDERGAEGAPRHRRSRSRSRTRTRTRSRSPRRHRDETARRRSPVEKGKDSRGERRQRRRSRSAGDDGESRHHRRRHHHHHRHHRHRDGHKETGSSGGKKAVVAAAPPASLPYDARSLLRADLDAFRPLLAYYLDVQKEKDIRDMDEREVRGRWKSFVAKWNRGELSQGWYDPEMFMAAKERAAELGLDAPRRADDEEAVDSDRRHEAEEEEEDGGKRTEDDDYDNDDANDDDEDLGPSLPPTVRDGNGSGHHRSGPGIPSMADLSLHRETLAEEAQREREAEAEELRQRRKEDRKLQRERLDELVPRAEAGTRERMLEKRALVGDKMKEFRERGGGDGQAEVGERELMGGGDSLADYKAMKAQEERKKTEREVRREEIARARAAEREERIKEYREREDRVMKGLKELARQRFG